jgi:hypothetical protein
VLIHILLQFLKVILINLGFIVPLLIQHLYIKINLANKPIVVIIAYAFPIVYKNIKGA